MGTAERRLEIMKILCRRRYEKMSNLAFEFGVSLRTIQRDINEISATIPIYIKTGRYEGGVYVLGEYYPDHIYMQEEELILLRKIRGMLVNNERCLLDNYEIQLFDKLIEEYSRPSAK